MAFDYISGLAENLVTTATSITPSSENSNYDADNVGVGWPAQPFRFNTAAADDTLDFDLGSTKQPTFFSIHGHNIDSGITSITIISDTSSGFGASPTTVATITTYPVPTFFKLISSPTARRYWRFKFNGTNGNPIEIGEVVIGVKKSLTRTQLIKWKIQVRQPQIRVSGKGIPQDLVSNLSDFQQRTITLTFLAENYTEINQIRDELFVGTKWGEEPIICIPDSTDEIVIHGRVAQNYTVSRIPGPSGGYHKINVVIKEDPFAFALT